VRRLTARSFDRQHVEATLSLRFINRFTALGKPASVRIT